MKKKLALAAALVLVLSLTAYGTVAFLTASDTAHNVITAGTVTIELLDQTKTGGALETFPASGVKVMPGSAVSKVVSVKNTGESTCWVRVKLENNVTLASASGASAPAGDNVGLDLNTEQWCTVPGSDGWYYYRNPLPAGETTAPLFTEVSFSSDIGNDYQEAKLDIGMSAQAVQAAHNGETAEDVSGWPADGNQ